MLKLGRLLFGAVATLAGLASAVLAAMWLGQRHAGDPIGPWPLFTAIGIAVLALLLRHLLVQVIRARGDRALEAARRGETFTSGSSLTVPAGWVALALLAGWLAWSNGEQARNAALFFAGFCVSMSAMYGWKPILRMLRSEPLLRIDGDGIEHLRYGPIAWRDVAGIQLERRRVRGQPRHTLWLAVRDVRRYLDDAPATALTLATIARVPGTGEFAPLPLPLDLFAEDPEVIQRVARALRQRHPALFLAQWSPHMAPSQVASALQREAAARAGGEAAATLVTVPAKTEAKVGAPAMETLRARAEERRMQSQRRALVLLGAFGVLGLLGLGLRYLA